MAATTLPPPSTGEASQDCLTHTNRIAVIGQLSASIAHEVSQPIAATLINAEAAIEELSNPSPDVEQVRRAIERVLSESRRAASVLSAIHALAQKAPPQRDHCQLNEVIREVLELTHGEALDHSVAVATQLADPLPSVWGDRVQLQQVVLNLVINAIEAMCSVADGPRQLEICTASDATRVSVSVRDTGIGLNPRVIGRLFQAFYTTKAGGLGVGLSICRQIIANHRGSIRAIPSNGRGSTFRFSVPRSSFEETRR
jgi:C4-dicarboxylate-specific signal transduction histidine kinase